MAAALVVGANFGAGANGGTSASLDTTGATLLVVCISFFWTATLPTVTDSKSNTWTLRYNSLSTTGNTRAAMYTMDNAPTVGTGHTFTINGTGIFSNGQVLTFSGTQAPSFDQVISQANGSSTSSTPGTITPSTSATVFVTGLSPDSAAGSTFTIDSGFDATYQNGGTGGVSFAGATAWLANTGTGAISPTWTLPAAVPSACGMAAFKVTQSAASSSTFFQGFP